MPWPKGLDHTLVVYCSDPWYREATAEFLAYHSQIAQYDQIVLPGGPGVAVQSSFTFTSDRPRIRQLYLSHGLKKVIAIAHRNCIYYRRRHPALGDETRVRKQLEDLKEFSLVIGKLLEGIPVETYFAESTGEHVQFTQM